MKKRETFRCGLLLIVCALAAEGGEWPSLRGPAHNGVASGPAPTEWSSSEGVKWRVALPQPGNGSAIVIGGRVLVTAAEDADGKRRSLYCFDAETGKRQWVRTVELDKKMPTHKTNPYCGTTPASDGASVVVWHASAGLHCYDLRGKSKWKKDLGEFRHMWGYGASPIIHGGRVFLNSGPGERCFVAAYDLKSGEQVWRRDEPQSGNGERNAAGKYMGSWATPIITRVRGKDQLIVPMSTRVVGYDLDSGDILWTCRGGSHPNGDLAYSMPIVVNDLCFYTAGFSGPSLSIRLGGQGDVTETHRLWRVSRSPQSIGTGVAVNGYVYRPNAKPNSLECIDPKTGEILWTHRVRGGPIWGSLVMSGELLYAPAQTGEITVFRPNPKQFEQVSLNTLGDTSNATPAIAQGRIYVRGFKELVCIGK